MVATTGGRTGPTLTGIFNIVICQDTGITAIIRSATQCICRTGGIITRGPGICQTGGITTPVPTKGRGGIESPILFYPVQSPYSPVN